MSKKFLIPIDMAGLEILNYRFQNLGTAPSSPTEGMCFYDTVSHAFKFWNGTSWVTGGGVTAHSDLTGLTSGDDHTQYMANASARTVTAVHTFSPGSATAPFILGANAQNQLVTGLNADKLDSLDSTAFALLAGAAFTGNVSITDHNLKLVSDSQGGAIIEFKDTGGNSQAGAITCAGMSVSGDWTFNGSAIYANEIHSAGNIIAGSGVSTGGNLFGNGSNVISVNSSRLTNVVDPTSAQDAATKAYVDAVSQGLSTKGSAAAATTAALAANTYANGTSGVGATLTGNSNGALAAVDGYTAVAGDVILVKDESTTSHNGLYTVTTVGDGSHPYVLTRTTNLDSATEVTGAYVFVRNGTVNANQGWIVDSSGPYTIGTTAITFTQFSGLGDITAGTGLSKSGNTISIDSSYVGQNTIVTLGTVTTGTWSATTIAVNKGGTGATTAAAARSNLGAVGKYAANLGDGSTTAFTVNHALGSTDCSVTVFYASTNSLADVEVAVTRTDSNNVVVTFATAPTTNQFRVVVIG